MDVSFKMCGCCDSNGTATIFQEPVSIKSIIFCRGSSPRTHTQPHATGCQATETIINCFTAQKARFQRWKMYSHVAQVWVLSKRSGLDHLQLTIHDGSEKRRELRDTWNNAENIHTVFLKNDYQYVGTGAGNWEFFSNFLLAQTGVKWNNGDFKPILISPNGIPSRKPGIPRMETTLLGHNCNDF